MAIFNAQPSAAPSTTLSAARSAARTLVESLESGGWTQREAGNLVALAHGLRPVSGGWTVREIEHLRFLHLMVRTGRIDSNA